MLTPAPSYFKTLSASASKLKKDSTETAWYLLMKHVYNQNLKRKKSSFNPSWKPEPTVRFGFGREEETLKKPAFAAAFTPHPRCKESESGDRQIGQRDIPGHGDGRLRGGHEAHGGSTGHRGGWDRRFRRIHRIAHRHQVKGRNSIDIEGVRCQIVAIHISGRGVRICCRGQ